MLKRDVLLIIYQNRTGSTFLANQLSSHHAISVAPEGHEAIGRLLRPNATGDNLQARIDRLASDLIDDPKLVAWRIDPMLFRKRVSNATTELDVFFGLCDSFADTDKPDARIMGVKGHFLADLIATHGYENLQRDRAVKALFLVRDPRAMFASQRRSISSRTGKPMQDNPVVAGLRWREFAKTAERFSAPPHGMCVQYENLIEDNETTLQEIYTFLSLERTEEEDRHFPCSESGRLVDLIPDEQKHLHTNIARPPMKDRVNRWQHELSDNEVAAIEIMAGKAMNRFGYNHLRGMRINWSLLGSLCLASASAAMRLMKLSRIVGQRR